MIALAVTLSLLAFLLLGLSTDDHHRRRFGHRPAPSLVGRMRIGGWLALGAGFPCAVMAKGWVFGPILWAAIVMLAAGVVFLALNLIPTHSHH